MFSHSEIGIVLKNQLVDFCILTDTFSRPSYPKGQYIIRATSKTGLEYDLKIFDPTFEFMSKKRVWNAFEEVVDNILECTSDRFVPYLGKTGDQHFNPRSYHTVANKFVPYNQELGDYEWH